MGNSQPGVNNPGYPLVQDEGVTLARKQILNFTGAGVVASNNSASGRIDIIISGGGVGSLVAHHESHESGGTDAFTAALPLAAIPGLNASYISAGQLAVSLIPTLNASYTQAGVFGTARIPTINASFIDGVLGVGAIPALNASYINAGALAAAQVPALDASYITAGIFGTARVPTIGAESINGVFGVANIPALNASYMSAGVIGSARVPTNYIIAGISMILDGGGTLVASGSRVSVELPFNCTILQASALSPIVGSIFMNFKSSPVGSYPTLANIGTIALIGTYAYVDSTLTGWTTALAMGNLLELYALGGISGVQQVTANLKVVKT